MKRLITCLLILAAAVTANAQLKKYMLEVGDFSELVVNDDINVVYKYIPDSAGYAMYVCQPSVAHALTFSAKDRKLKIEVISDNPITEPLPTIVLYSSQLDKVVNQGDSLVTIESVNPGDSFTAKVIGNGTLRVNGVHSHKLSAAVEAGKGSILISGVVTEAKYTLVSVGTINALDVRADIVTCRMAGSGAINCSVANSLTVYGAGTGVLRYKGKPLIKKRSVGVKIEELPAN